VTTVRAFGPGRVNLIGEHTDYNDGLCLPFAIARGVTVEARSLAGGRVEARAADLGEDDAFAAGDPPRAGADGWRGFVRGTVAELRAAGFEVEGATLRITGDVPRGGGLSSSAAMSTALALAFMGLAGGRGEDVDRRALARLCSRVENDWVGAQTGLLDQLAALFGRVGHALRLDCRDLSIEPVALELGDWTVAVVDSGERHAHASSGYNERRTECARACAELGVQSLRDAGAADDPGRLPAPLDRRVRHVLSENARVDAAVDALRAGDMAALGALLDASHASLRDDYEVSVPAVEAAIARCKAAGAAGARIVGGGFGGSVLALFAPGATPPPDAVVVEPGPAARLLDAG